MRCSVRTAVSVPGCLSGQRSGERGYCFAARDEMQPASLAAEPGAHTFALDGSITSHIEACLKQAAQLCGSIIRSANCVSIVSLRRSVARATKQLTANCPPKKRERVRRKASSFKSSCGEFHHVGNEKPARIQQSTWSR